MKSPLCSDLALTNPHCQVVESYGNKNRNAGDTDTPYFAVDATCVTFFTVDIVLRCLVAPVSLSPGGVRCLNEPSARENARIFIGLLMYRQVE